MKTILTALALILSLNAQAMDLQLFANINVVDTATVIGTGSNSSGGTSISDIDIYSSEETFVIGKATLNGISQQVIAKVAGCGLVKDRSNILLRISNKPNIYNGYFSQSTYELKLNNRQECLNMQRGMRQAQFDKIVNIKINQANKSFSLVSQ